MIVIQLSDPHILAPGELLYRRFDTAEFLSRAVAEINRLDPLPDVAVVTGDLVDHGDPPRIRASASAAGTTCDAGLRHSRQSQRPRAATRCLRRRRLSAG